MPGPLAHVGAVDAGLLAEYALAIPRAEGQHGLRLIIIFFRDVRERGVEKHMRRGCPEQEHVPRAAGKLTGRGVGERRVLHLLHLRPLAFDLVMRRPQEARPPPHGGQVMFVQPGAVVFFFIFGQIVPGRPDSSIHYMTP